MNLTLKRFELRDACTIGKLYINDKYCCYTLEDKVQYPKIPGKTAIPYGHYQVVLDYSRRFNKDMLHVLDVPNFAGIRIHAGNTAADTEGCILVGEVWDGSDSIRNSTSALVRLLAAVTSVLADHEPVYLDIVDA